MAEVVVVDQENQEKEMLSLRESIFGVTVNPALLHEVVVMQLNNARRGTASTKTRGEVRGGGRKPWRQKGTGRARHGSIRSPIWRGGGTVFGPKPRDYSYTMPKRKVRGALCGALTAVLQEGRLRVLDRLEIPSQKTRDAARLLDRLAADGSVLLVGTPEECQGVERAVRNLPYVTLRDYEALNVYDVLRHDVLVFSRTAIEAFQEVMEKRLQGRRGEAA